MNSAAAARTTGAEIEVESPLLGELSVPADQTFTFPAGILGFPECRDFVLVPAEREGFFWLQSLDAPALVFVAVDPFRFVDGYSVELGPTELGGLLPEEPDDLLVLSIVTLPRAEGEPATINLRGPLALNLPQRRARQVVLDGPWGLRHPIQLQ